MTDEFDRNAILSELVELAGFPEDRQPDDVSAAEVAAASGKSPRAVQYHLNQAVAAGKMGSALRYDPGCKRIIRVWWKL